MKLTLRGFYVGAVSVLLASATALATPVSGTIDVSSITNTTVMTGAVYFGTGDHSTTGINAVAVNNGTGDFTGATTAWFRNLVGPGGPSGAPVSGAVNIPDFAEITTPGGTVQVNLTKIVQGFNSGPGSCSSTAVGAECSPVIDGVQSPFTIIQTSDNTVLFNLTFQGIAFYPPSSSGTSQLVDIFTSQGVMGTIPSILAEVESGTGFSHSWSATIEATPNTVPEPASLLLMGVGLLGVGIIARKRVNRTH